jgi:hypothetical protein
VHGARARGRFARVEVRRDCSPGGARVLGDLAGLPGGLVRFAERAPVDMEATLLALAQGLVTPGAPGSPPAAGGPR